MFNDSLIENDVNYIGFHLRYGFITSIIIAVVLIMIILMTIFGNILVIAAVFKEKHLRNIANYLIVSLAGTDLIVACFVMTMSAINELSSNWFLGVYLCDFWVIIDVLSCSACIFHLVVIAIDRYYSITSALSHPIRQNPRLFLCSIILIWIIASAIAVPARFYSDRDIDIERNNNSCLINNGYGYTLYSTLAAFYIPMLFLVCIYWQIYNKIVTRIRTRRQKLLAARRLFRQITRSVSNKSGHWCWKLIHIRQFIHRCRNTSIAQFPANESGDSKQNILVLSENDTSDIVFIDEEIEETQTSSHLSTTLPPTLARISSLASLSVPPPSLPAKKPNHIHKHKTSRDHFLSDLDHRKYKLELKREHRTATTLAIITGCFLICWLPFFLWALLAPFSSSIQELPHLVYSVFLWLGYCNCLCNPIIYTVFSSDFRNTFKKFLHLPNNIDLNTP